MKKFVLPLLCLALLISCATVPPSTLSITDEIRNSSSTDEKLFVDLFGAPGGVGFADKTLYPNARNNEIVQIEVITPYDNEQVGVERWYVQHDQNEKVSYLVKLTPDGKGGTIFTVQPEN